MNKEPAMFEQLKSRFADWRQYRRTVRQLTHLDRRLLADAGIEPDQIRERARIIGEGSPSRW
jgi:uncharacterized protein YjiS (DUF1127 family)